MTNEASGRNPAVDGVRFFAVVTALVAFSLFFGCSSNNTGGATSGGTTSGGGVSSSTAPAAGSVAPGGSIAIGGSSESGGIPAFAGIAATGGTTVVSGGATPSGGSPDSGGATSSGGATTIGGSTSLGSATSSGGASTLAGTTKSGGATVLGGTTGFAGATSSGGATKSGGTTSSGGATGSGGASTLGGATSSGGKTSSGGATTSSGGATTSSGGATASGGTTRTGGTASTGGASSAGGSTFTGPNYPYVFACFNDSAAASTLMIYTSNDALNFTLLYDTGYGGPTGNLRDPSIMRHTDGKFYIVHTTPPAGTGCCGAESSFNVASSSDLKTWTTITQVPSGVAGVKNVWAPEWFKDTDGSIHVLVSIDAKTYRYEPTDGTFTKWGAGKWIGIGPDYIDTFMVKIGTTYHAFTKHESVTYVEHATSTSLDGPWDFGTDTNNWAGWGNHKEAPCLVQLSNGTWRFYADAGSAGHEMYSDSIDVFQTWTAIKTLPTVGNNISHGTVIKGN